MFGKAFKPRSHYVFDYKPRFYSESKERIENLRKKYHGDKESSNDTPKISLTKSNLKDSWTKNKRMASDRATIKRLAIIITLLVGIAAYILDFHRLF